MVTALITILAAAVAADLLFSAAIIYHLTRYTLPGWSAAKIVVPAYFALTLAAVAAAVYSILTLSG